MRSAARTLRLYAGLAFALCSFAARAESYPDKPLHLIVPFATGSATDQLARALAQEIARETHQPAIVENKPGASGFLAAQAAARAAPDGYTVLISTNTTHAANPHLYRKLPYDPIRDFAPVTALGKGGQIMIVRPDLPVRSVAEFIALAKRQPDQLTFGSGSSSSRVAAELFQQMADIRLVHVPYKSNPLAINDLLGGRIDMMITDTATGLPQVRAGKARVLGVTARRRSALAPDVPTLDEAGVKGYEMGYWFAAYVPAHTRETVVTQLHDILTKATQGATMRNFYQSSGTERFVTSPGGLARFQAAETEKWGHIIRAAGIEPE